MTKVIQQDGLGAQLLAALHADEQEETPEKGFLTRKEWAAEIKRSERQTREIISAQVSKGKMEVRKYRRKTAAGYLFPVPHYRMVK